MVHWVKGLAAKPRDLSLTSGTHKLERDKHATDYPLTSTFTECHVSTPHAKQINVKKKKKSRSN